jgi:hypothetical protein
MTQALNDKAPAPVRTDARGGNQERGHCSCCCCRGKLTVSEIIAQREQAQRMIETLTTELAYKLYLAFYAVKGQYQIRKEDLNP